MNKHEHDQRLIQIGCIVCRRMGVYSPTTIHHIRKLSTSKKRKLAPKIPLCPAHHQYGGYGVALHAGEKAFEKNYGSVIDMLNEVEIIIKQEVKS